MDNMRERLIVRIMVIMMGLFTTAYIYAADETVTMKVGETKTLLKCTQKVGRFITMQI